MSAPPKHQQPLHYSQVLPQWDESIHISWLIDSPEVGGGGKRLLSSDIQNWCFNGRLGSVLEMDFSLQILWNHQLPSLPDEKTSLVQASGPDQSCKTTLVSQLASRVLFKSQTPLGTRKPSVALVWWRMVKGGEEGLRGEFGSIYLRLDEVQSIYLD